MKKVLLLPLMLALILPAFPQNGSYFDSVFTEYFRLDSGGWTAGDATISVPLPDGRVIWLFGDSYIVDVDTSDNTLPCLFQIRNCYTVQDSADRSSFRTIIDSTQSGINQTTFKLALNDTTVLWPGHGYVWNDTVYIFLEDYHSANYAYLGCYLAKLAYPSLGLIEIEKVHGNGDSAIYGRALIVDTASGFLYIYGNKLNWIVQEPVVARVDADRPDAPWEYYTGTGWSFFPNQAQKISGDPVSPGFSVIQNEDKYYIITQENGYLQCGLGREIYSMESDHPWGPFINRKLLYTEESKFNGWYLLTYNAQAHPYFTEANELLCSYNVNDRVDTIFPYICPSQCRQIWTDRLDADTYRPKFFRVPFGLITGRVAVETDGPALTVYPNPASPGATVACRPGYTKPEAKEVIIMNSFGQILEVFQLPSGEGGRSFYFRAPGTPGTYFVQLRYAGRSPATAKLIVI